MNDWNRRLKSFCKIFFPFFLKLKLHGTMERGRRLFLININSVVFFGNIVLIKLNFMPLTVFGNVLKCPWIRWNWDSFIIELYTRWSAMFLNFNEFKVYNWNHSIVKILVWHVKHVSALTLVKKIKVLIGKVPKTSTNSWKICRNNFIGVLFLSVLVGTFSVPSVFVGIVLRTLFGIFGVSPLEKNA